MSDPIHADDLCTLYLGDCVEVMRELPADSVDAIVTDPPYGLEFMGKEWDRLGAVSGGAGFGQPGIGERPIPWTSFNGSPNPSCLNCGGTQRGNDGQGVKRCHCDNPEFPNRRREQSVRMQTWHEAWAREAFRVAKPGAHLLAFGGTRTVHRLASAIEDAGWEIRDCLVWAYASGFPKSLDVSKAIDKAAGAERVRIRGVRSGVVAGTYAQDKWSLEHKDSVLDGTPLTPEAAKWNGWGTALKPAWEPIVMARKPLRGTVAANVLAHGTGALNIDATRIGTEQTVTQRSGRSNGSSFQEYGKPAGIYEHDAAGRWPANLILTDPIFDGDTPGVVGGGEAQGGESYDWSRHADVASFKVGRTESIGYGDSGTYSRFFLIPKSSRSDREPVLRPDGHDGSRISVHPTMKPTDLMRHLVRLVTPPGGTVLDCFLGSGTTAIAAEMEGFAWVGIEKEPEYVAIAEARLNGVQRGMAL